MNIFLVRHAQSESNVDPKELHLKTNMAINLSPLGRQQALEAGLFISSYLQGSTKVWNSPYNRTRQTAAAITDALKAKNLGFVEEESIYLAERQFGLVDDVAQYHEKFPLEAKHYKLHKEHEHDFFVRPPLGESPFDMCTRLDFFIKSVLREELNIENHIIVSHGAAIRGFIMMHQKHKYETYTSPNPPNASVRLIVGSEYVGEIFSPQHNTY